MRIEPWISGIEWLFYKQKQYFGVEFVAQMREWLLPAPDDPGSTPMGAIIKTILLYIDGDVVGSNLIIKNIKVSANQI